MTLLIRGGRVVDPTQSLDRVCNVLLHEGRVAELDYQGEANQTIDASGLIVCPGLLDLHAELCEPGKEENETIVTGGEAALAGGFSSICCMTNTQPPLDTQAGVEYVRHKAARARGCHVFVLGCISKGRQGEELSEIGSLVEAGAVGFSDAPRPISNPNLLRRALEYCRMFEKPILTPPEAVELTQDGIMHEGLVSLRLGLMSMPSEAEDMMAARDIRLAESTGGHLHLINISTEGSVELLRRAKSRGAPISASVCAYNFSMTDELLNTFDSNAKVRPPLRSEEHVEACIEGLRDGSIDAIASGHAPRALEKKMRVLDRAPFGMSMLESVLSLSLMNLVEPGRLTLSELVEKLSCAPARILRLDDRGTLRPGAQGDVTVFDPNESWVVAPQNWRSRSCNTPLLGRTLRGRARHVCVRGELRYSAR